MNMLQKLTFAGTLLLASQTFAQRTDARPTSDFANVRIKIEVDGPRTPTNQRDNHATCKDQKHAYCHHGKGHGHGHHKNKGPEKKHQGSCK